VKVVFLGKNKRSAARALELLVERGCELRGVVAQQPDRFTRDEQRLDLVAERHGLRLVSEDELYASVDDLRDTDVVVSFLFWNRIREPLLSLGRTGCLNFHPAPLPDMRGVGGINVALLEGRRDWGVSCHFVAETFDTGDLVEVERFAIEPGEETAWSLDVRSQERLLALFERVLDRLLSGEALPRLPQGLGRYVTREEMERLRRVRPGDDLERKLRAFWYPPYPGATVELGGRVLTLVDERTLAELAELLRARGPLP
jgi:methionyl-tRNA formyltransferase